MVILFESSGSFNTGKPSYRALISKRSRGMITLSETELSFQSKIDKILYQIKTKDIKNFRLKNKFLLTVIELEDRHSNVFTLHVLIKKKNSYSKSKTFTLELFHHLSRTLLRKGKPIFFESGGAMWAGKPNLLNWKTDMTKGILILTEDNLSFKPLYKGGSQVLKITEIKKLKSLDPSSFDFIEITLNNGESYTITSLTKKLGRKKINHSKMEKLSELLNQVIMYKSSEQIKLKELEKERIEKIKSMLDVSSKIRLDLMRTALEMEEKAFSNKIFEWAKKFNFVIEGNFLVVNPDYVPDFLENLYGQDELQEKIQCRYCQKLIPTGSGNCPYCGVEIHSKFSP